MGCHPVVGLTLCRDHVVAACRCLLEIQQAGDLSATVPDGIQSPFIGGKQRMSLSGRRFRDLSSIPVTTNRGFTIDICMAVFLPLFRSYEVVRVEKVNGKQVVTLEPAPGLVITFANSQTPGVFGLCLAIAFCLNGLVSDGNSMDGAVRKLPGGWLCAS